MPDDRADLPDAELQSGENLGFTETELWAELDRIFQIEMRQPGDLTAEEIAEHYGMSDETVRVKFKPLVNKGIYDRVRVMGTEGRPVMVYRKKSK